MNNITNLFRTCKCETNYDHCKKLKHKCICSAKNKKQCKSEEHECICCDCILGQLPLTKCLGGHAGQHLCTCQVNPNNCRKIFVDLPFYPSSTIHVYGVHHKCVCKFFQNSDKICKKHNGPAKNKKRIRGMGYKLLTRVDNDP